MHTATIDIINNGFDWLYFGFSQINLLDMKRSMNVNIFLKQFRLVHEGIIKLIRDGDQNLIGPERLKGLINIMPDKDEVHTRQY